MVNTENIQTLLLNQLASEVIVLDEGFNIIWLNDSAKSNGWIGQKDEKTPIINQFLEETSAELTSLFKDCMASSSSITKRDFRLAKPNEKNRMADLTVTWSELDKILIIEMLCTDNLNKIIDSSKNFSTQKIAANLARTLAHEVKNPVSYTHLTLPTTD